MNNVTVTTLPFEIAPSPIMFYMDYGIKESGKTLTVSYLADDEDGENPVMYCDGMGAIFTSHRNARRSEHERMQEALALDSSWDPDLSLLESGAPELAFRKAWIAAAKQHVEFMVWADETGRRSNPDEAYYHRRASAFWRECGRSGIGGVSIWHFAFSESVAHEVWADLREQGVIGAKDLVMLDCYEHGGQSWSISGTGTQCRWDTSRGAGVWVPDADCIAAIELQKAVYAFGDINKVRGSWQVSLDASDTTRSFSTEDQAYLWLSIYAEGKKVTKKMLATGRDRAHYHICRGVLDQYNAWLAGECYGVVVATFSNIGTEAEPEWELEGSDETWGYIGSDYTAAMLPTVLN